MRKEKIVCAAIKIEWIGALSLDHSEVICGVNHDTIRRTMVYQNIKYLPDNRDFRSQKGFITNKNRFVDAIEARRIASDSGQVPMIMLTSNPPKIKPLTPEELY